MTDVLRTMKVMILAATLLVLPQVRAAAGSGETEPDNQVLEWNQTFVNALIATNTPNSSSQRLGAIVHTAIFDALNGIERRLTPVYYESSAPPRASPRAAVVAAAHTALVGLFPTQQAALDTRYDASVATLRDRCHGTGHSPRSGHACLDRIDRGLAWGVEVAQAVLAWRATDGLANSYPAFTGGAAVGQWRPTPPAFGPMSAQGLAFTAMFVRDQPTPLFNLRSRGRSAAPPTPKTSMWSRHWVAEPARPEPTTSRLWRRSGRGTPACTGTRRPIRWRAPIT